MDFPLPDSPPTLRERVAITIKCERDADFRERVLEKCGADAAWWASCFAWTFNPKIKDGDKDLPFILPGRFEYQIDVFRWLDDRYANRESGVVDKSREMGLTWSTLIWTLHRWLFEPGFQALVGSRKEDLVDNRTLSSHFGKLTWLLKKLPGWMLPKGFSFDKHRMKLKLENPENGALIEGESMNPDFSRQARYSIIFIDEAASWPILELAWEACSASSDVKILVSTPKGIEFFHYLRHSGNLPVLTVHWSLDPEKDDEWYERQKKELVTPEAVAQELDINYQKSQEGVVYPGWVNVPKGHYPFEEDRHSLYATIDFGVADETGIIWFGVDPRTGKRRMVDAYKNKGKPISFYAPFILGYLHPKCREFDYSPDDLAVISRHSGWGMPVVYGDPAGHQRSATTATSPIEVLASEFGIHVQVNNKLNDYASRKQFTEMGLSDLEGVHIEHCYEVDNAMLNARFATRSRASRSTNAVSKPIHDWTSHFRSCVEYFFVNIPRPRLRPRPSPTKADLAYNHI